MRRRFSSILLGLLFIAAGIGYAGNVLDLWQFEIFFDGWWALFIIVPCAISIIDHGFDAGNVIGIGIGVMLLLSAQNLIDFDIVWRLFVPLILIAIGLSVIFRHNRYKEFSAAKMADAASSGFQPSGDKSKARAGTTEITAIFSSEKRALSSEISVGSRITAVFGGVEIDLRGATIANDIIIDCTAIFGGIDLYLPPQTPVYFDCFKMFAGASDERPSANAAAGGSVYITGTALFGGIEVR